MSIPNVSTLYQRINKGSEGGQEFARFIKLLLLADYGSQGIQFVSESDASGDFNGVDGYVAASKEMPELITGFQYKFFPQNINSNQKTEIENSIIKALEENPLMQDFILVTPEDFQKSNQEWFEQLQKKYYKMYPVWGNGMLPIFYNFNLHHWGHTKIIELALKHDHIGVTYFPELFPIGIGKFKLSKAAIDSDNCLWRPFDLPPNTIRQIESNTRNGSRSSDPVFDFHFKNSTSEIHLLNRIEVHIESVWTDIKGFKKEQFLRSVGTFIHEMDFTLPVNTVALLDPMIFEANQPKRFKIQLKDFVKNCPGNFAQVKFWFFFDEIVVPTNPFILDF